MPLAVQAQDDPAYVDSPAGRSIPDPARADGGTVVAGAVSAASAPGGGTPAMTPLMQMQMQALRAAQQQPAQAASPQPGMGQAYGPAGMGPPMGPGQGYGLSGMGQQAGMGPAGDMPDAGQQAGMPAGYGGAPTGYSAMQPGPMQQLGSGLMQDAAGLIDAGIQRQTGPVVVYPSPGAMPNGSDW